MDAHSFDDLSRIIATTITRRGLVAGSAAGILAALQSGTARNVAGKKRRKKKKKKPSLCTPSCFNKVCGQDDGCGNPCTIQAGCGTDEACINGACRASSCIPACTGNHICQPNGRCACPSGLKGCQGQGFGDNCHECCPDALSGGGDNDCEGSPKGAYCKDLANDGELFLTCGCFSAATTCPNGACGGCCRPEDCYLDVFGTGPVDTGRECVVGNQETGEYACRCRSGTYACPLFTFCAEPGNVRACGANCDDCNFGQPYQNYVCEGNPERCCLPTGSPCALDNDRCCSGLAACVLNDQGTSYVCA